MVDRLTFLIHGPDSVPLGRADVAVWSEDHCSLVVLEIVCRTDDITVWLGRRALAVMPRLRFVRWLWEGGCYVVDDLAWVAEGRTCSLVVDGRRTYMLNDVTVQALAGLVANSG